MISSQKKWCDVLSFLNSHTITPHHSPRETTPTMLPPASLHVVSKTAKVAQRVASQVRPPSPSPPPSPPLESMNIVFDTPTPTTSNDFSPLLPFHQKRERVSYGFIRVAALLSLCTELCHGLELALALHNPSICRNIPIIITTSDDFSCFLKL